MSLLFCNVTSMAFVEGVTCHRYTLNFVFFCFECSNHVLAFWCEHMRSKYSLFRTEGVKKWFRKQKNVWKVQKPSTTTWKVIGCFLSPSQLNPAHSYSSISWRAAHCSGHIPTTDRDSDGSFPDGSVTVQTDQTQLPWKGYIFHEDDILKSLRLQFVTSSNIVRAESWSVI